MSKTQVPTATGAHDEIIALIRRMEKDNPDPEDVKTFRKMLANSPALWAVAGDLMRIARDKMLAGLNANALTRESVEEGIRRIARELVGEDAPLIERLLAEHAALCWANYYLTQHHYHSVMEEPVTLAQGAYWEKRLATVQRRYLRALETLARVRRLLRPHALQVNIGAQQVNVLKAEKANDSNA